MNLKKSFRSAASQAPLLGAVMDGYVTWREESIAVAASYERWRCAARDERALAFDSYLAALDREEDAAAAYRDLVEVDG